MRRWGRLGKKEKLRERESRNLTGVNNKKKRVTWVTPILTKIVFINISMVTEGPRTSGTAHG